MPTTVTEQRRSAASYVLELGNTTREIRGIINVQYFDKAQDKCPMPLIIGDIVLCPTV
jgi:hypothetical protein